jgi:hypothetical protein
MSQGKRRLPTMLHGMSGEGQCVLLLDQFSTPYPSLCDATPYGLILAIPRDFRHKLAFGGKSQKPF